MCKLFRFVNDAQSISSRDGRDRRRRESSLEGVRLKFKNPVFTSQTGYGLVSKLNLRVSIIR